MQKFLILGSVLAVSACGGGGGTSVTSTAPSGPPELLAYIADQERIAPEITSRPASDQTVFTALAGATNPVVTYDGVMILDEQVNAPSGAYYGDLTASADFNTSTLTGSATAFVYFNDANSNVQGSRRTGTLTLNAAALAPDDPGTATVETFPITVGGTLNQFGDGVGERAATGTIDGAFAGGSAQWLAGQGTVTINGVTFQTLIVAE